jgi:hypothetical protein
VSSDSNSELESDVNLWELVPKNLRVPYVGTILISVDDRKSTWPMPSPRTTAPGRRQSPSHPSFNLGAGLRVEFSEDLTPRRFAGLDSLSIRFRKLRCRVPGSREYQASWSCVALDCRALALRPDWITGNTDPRVHVVESLRVTLLSLPVPTSPRVVRISSQHPNMKFLVHRACEITFYSGQSRSLAFYSSWQPSPSRDPSMVSCLSVAHRFIG